MQNKRNMGHIAHLSHIGLHRKKEIYICFPFVAQLTPEGHDFNRFDSALCQKASVYFIFSDPKVIEK